ncbi:MAG: alpha/beta fold hydrolase [Nocardioides sp.]|uniref:alpha/beta fold hydrolase n=1 Tax=Nocardioides sp. TaxID=35761 RepID=UPI0039E596DB
MASTLTDPLSRLRREVERNAARAKNGIKYLAGTDWTPPAPTPRDLIWQQGTATLWRYRSDQVTIQPPALMMIGLVSRSYIFDLHEKASLVRALRDHGFDVYVLDWGIATAADADNTLETYLCRYFARAVRAVLRTSSTSDVSLVGYCMGGAMALQGMAGMPDLPIRNLVTMAAPLDFTQLPSHVNALRDPDVDFESFIDPQTGCIPPDLVDSFFRIRKPTAAATQYANLLENLWNDAYVEGHQAITRWTADHVPMPGGVARQVVTTWLRGNAFMNGTLRLAGRAADLSSIRCPVLGILTLQDEIVPPDVARPIGDLVGSSDVEMHELDAGHIGLLVGRAAHKVTLPKLVGWLHEHSDRKED